MRHHNPDLEAQLKTSDVVSTNLYWSKTGKPGVQGIVFHS